MSDRAKSDVYRCRPTFRRWLVEFVVGVSAMVLFSLLFFVAFHPRGPAFARALVDGRLTALLIQRFEVGFACCVLAAVVFWALGTTAIVTKEGVKCRRISRPLLEFVEWSRIANFEFVQRFVFIPMIVFSVQDTGARMQIPLIRIKWDELFDAIERLAPAGNPLREQVATLRAPETEGPAAPQS